jgi:hypothetical protein
MHLMDQISKYRGDAENGFTLLSCPVLWQRRQLHLTTRQIAH